MHVKFFADIKAALEAAADLAVGQQLSVGGRMAIVTPTKNIMFKDTDRGQDMRRPTDGRLHRVSYKGARTVEEA